MELAGVGKMDIPEYMIYTDNSILVPIPIRNIRTQIYKDLIPESPSLNFSISLRNITEYHEPRKINGYISYINFNKLAQDSQELNRFDKLYKDTTDSIFVKPEHDFILL